jgi:hypothetical protein
MGSADRCQAPSDAGPAPGRRRSCQLFERAEPRVGKCCHACLRASTAGLYLTARAGLREGSKNHDARGDFASTRNGASLRGVELPELRILIEPSCSDAAIGASEGERTGYSGLRLVKSRRTLSRGGTSPSGICVAAQAGGARTNALTGQPCLTLLWFLGCSGSSERSRNSDR